MSGITRKFMPLIVAAALVGCARDSGPKLEDRTAPDILQEARQARAEGRPLAAAELFLAVDQYHPYSRQAKLALINAARSYFDGGDFEQTRKTAQIFVDYYPADARVAEARYLIAMSYYSQLSDVGRDQRNTERAAQALREVMVKHPQSPFAAEAQLNLDLTQAHLAGKEMEIARFYMRGKHYMAAINRFRVVVEEYSTTSHTPEALHRLVESYLALGLDDHAVTAAAVLGHNYQGSKWYAASYKLLQSKNKAELGKPVGWIGGVYRQVIKGEWM